MTKKQLLERLELFPDDTIICTANSNNSEFVDLQFMKLAQCHKVASMFYYPECSQYKPFDTTVLVLGLE
jgi:hypothetical protein